MMGFSLGHLIVLLVIILLFEGRRLPELGGALGKGLRSFKRGIEGKLDDEEKGKTYVNGPDSEAHSESQREAQDVASSGATKKSSDSSSSSSEA